MSDFIQYKTDAGEIGVIERDGTLIVVDPSAEYIDVTVFLDDPTDNNLNRAWYLDQPNFNGYNLSGQYGFRIGKDSFVDPFNTPGEFQIMTGIGRRLDYILNGQFSSIELGLSFRILFSEYVIIPDSTESDQIIDFAQTSRIDVDQLYANYISADSACIRILNCVESADIGNLSSRNHLVDNSVISNLSAGVADIDNLTSDLISAKSLVIGNYHYEPDAGIRYKESDGDLNRYIKFNDSSNLWDIVPNIKFDGLDFQTVLNGSMKFEARSTGFRSSDRLRSPISDNTVEILNNYDNSFLKINEEFVYENQEDGLTLTIIDFSGRFPEIRTKSSGEGRVIFSQNYDTFANPSESIQLSFKINGMLWGQIGIITSRYGYEPNLSEGLKSAAANVGLYKLAHTPNTSTHVPYFGIFQKTFDRGTRSFEETNSTDATTINPHVLGLITGDDFHVMGTSNPNLLVGFDNSIQAYINPTLDLQVSNRLLSEGARINNQLFLEPDEENGIKWDVVSRGESDGSQPTIYYDYESQSISIKLDKDSNDKLQFDLADINGVLQSGFINWHAGNFPKNKTLYGDAKIEARGTGQASGNNSFLLLNEEVVYSDSADSDNLNGFVQARGLRLSIFDSMGDLISSDDYDTWEDYANADQMAIAIDDMQSNQIGVITSFDSFERKLSKALKNSAYSAGLMKLYNTSQDDRGTPYAAIFHKSGSGTAIEGAKRGPRSYEVTSENLTDTLDGDLTAIIRNGTFYVVGETVSNSLHGYNGNAKAWIDSNDDLYSLNKIQADGGRMRSLLILEEGESNGIAWDDYRDGTFDSAPGLADIFNSWNRFSHNNTNTYPADSGEADAWVFDSSESALKCTQNTSTYVGFVSNITKEDYTLSVEMSSSATDDDTIGIVIAFVEEGGREYTLSALRTMGGMNPANGWGVYYNYRQSDEQLIQSATTTIARNSEGGGGWAVAGSILSEVIKEGNIISATTSDLNSLELDNATLIQVDLNSETILEKFLGAVQFGVSAFSQNDATLVNLTSKALTEDLIDGSGNGAKIYVKVNDVDSSHHLYVQADNICEIDEIHIKSGKVNLEPCADSHGAYVNENMIWNKGNLPNTDFLPEGETNLYWDSAFVAEPARNALSVVDNSGIGSLTYANATGVFTYDNITNTDSLPEGVTNLYYDSDRTSSNAKATISVVDNSGIGSLTYDNATGVITYDNITNTDGLPEGTTNLYHTDNRTTEIIETFVDSSYISSLSFEYELTATNNAGGANIELNPDDATHPSSAVSLLAGDNILISQAGSAITITGENGAVYELTAETDALGAKIKIDDGAVGSSEVILAGGGATTVTRNASGKITISSAVAATPSDATITLEAGDGLITGGNFTLNQAAGETIIFSHANTTSQISVDNSGTTYIQDIELDEFGHITSITSVEDVDLIYTLTSDSDGTGTYLRLSDGTTNNDVLLVGDSGISITSTTPGTITFTGTGEGGGGETYTAGDGITLIGTEFAVGAGVGLTQEPSGLAVDDTQVVLTTGDQSIAGDKSFTSSVIIDNGARITLLGAANIMDITTLAMKSGGADKFTFNGTTGDFTASGDVTAFSDERLKTEIKDIENPLDLVNMLRGVTYIKDNIPGIGLVAQEVEKILPEVVRTGEEYKSVAYGNIVGLLIEAVKELSEKVKELEKR